MRGIGSKPKEYVCEIDRSELDEDQTIFMLIPRNHERANRSSVKYNRAMQAGRSGEMDPLSMDRADRETFLDYCKQVKNYAFSEDFYEAHPQVKQMADDRGFVAVVDTPEMLTEVARDLPNSILIELANAVNDPVLLTSGLKKR